jgi:hypothetical protein
MARIVSASPQAGTVPMTSPVAGFVTSIVLPLSAAIQSPADEIRLLHPMLPVCHGPLPFVPTRAHVLSRRFAPPPCGHCKPRLRFPASDPNRYANAWFPNGRVCSMDLARRNGISAARLAPCILRMGAITTPRP